MSNRNTDVLLGGILLSVVATPLLGCLYVALNTAGAAYKPKKPTQETPWTPEIGVSNLKAYAAKRAAKLFGKPYIVELHKIVCGLRSLSPETNAVTLAFYAEVDAEYAKYKNGF